MATVINRYRGDTKPWKFRISVDGEIANITGYTFILTVDEKQNPPDETTKKFSMNGVLTDPVGGIIIFYPLDSDGLNSRNLLLRHRINHGGRVH